MHCTNCLKLKERQLRSSSPKRERQMCEHCGFPIDEKGRRLNQAGIFTDAKGDPGKLKRKRR